MRSRGESFGQIVIAVILAVLLGAAVGYATTDRVATESGGGTVAQSFAADSSNASSCRELGIDASSDREATCTTRSARLTFVNGTRSAQLPGFSVRVRSVKAFDAATPEGRARKRMRVTLSVRADTEGTTTALEPAADPRVYLSIGGSKVAPDGAWDSPRAFDLESPLAPGQQRSGQLRFELAGKQSETFLRDGAQFAVRPFDAASGGRAEIAIVRVPPTKPSALPD